MIQAHCIKKETASGKIMTYILQDQYGEIMVVASDMLKEAIVNREIEVDNLSLTSDNRLITKKQKDYILTSDKNTSRIVNNQIEIQLNKAKVLGIVDTIETPCKHLCYIIHTSKNSHTLLIPSDVTIPNSDSNRELNLKLSKLRGTLKVIGGYGLKDAYALFYNCMLQSLDLTQFCTSYIASMEMMFAYSKILTPLDLSNFNIYMVRTLERMFEQAHIPSINLSSFNTTPEDKNYQIRISEMFSASRIPNGIVTTDARITEEFNKTHIIKLQDIYDEILKQLGELRNKDYSRIVRSNNIDKLNMISTHVVEYIIRDKSNYLKYKLIGKSIPIQKYIYTISLKITPLDTYYTQLDKEIIISLTEEQYKLNSKAPITKVYELNLGKIQHYRTESIILSNILS